MNSGNKTGKKETRAIHPTSMPERSYHGRIYSPPDKGQCLDPVQLHRLEQSFRDWAGAALRRDVHASRRRILVIFLLIRYTGGKLSEVLGLDPFQDIDYHGHFVTFGRRQEQVDHRRRKVQLPETLCHEINGIITDPSFNSDRQNMLAVDPGFVRRKFYQRAEACGISKELGAPECLRKSRAVELMQSNMPLPAVQMLLGHSTPNLTSAYISFSEDDIQQVTRHFMQKESARKTSARNTFFGKIKTIRKGDIQTRVELVTIGGHCVTTVITNDSLQRLGLKTGHLITAEVKAPWVMLHKSDDAPRCSADNMFNGIVERVTRGNINAEYIVRIDDGTQVCAIVTSDTRRPLGIGEGDSVWVTFNAFAVVLLSD